MAISQKHGLDKHVKKMFEYRQKAKVLSSLNIVSDQLQSINEQACLDMLVQVHRKVRDVNAQYESKNRDMQGRIGEISDELSNN